jgi:hypothetical protein
LNAEPVLRRELENLSLAITKRLSPAEKAELKGENVGRMASSLGISTDQGASLRNIHERARALQENAPRQHQERVRGSQLDIRR